MTPLLFLLLTHASTYCTLGVAISKTAAPSLQQTSLSHCALSIGGHDLDVELAIDEPAREKGLMKRTSLYPNQGMLFIFSRAKQVAFWMKGTSFPLSVAYINSTGRIVELHDLQPFDEHPIPSTSTNIIYVLEVSRGWFTENNILAGDFVTGLPSPSAAR